MLQLLNFKDFWSEIGRAVMSFNSISDVLDVILVTFVIYSAIKLIRETKAVQLAKGFILLLIVYALVNLFGMQASNYILSLVFNNLLLVLVIIFTPEIRHALESVGRSSVSKFNFFGFRSGAEEKRREEMQKMVNAVCRASSDMSDKHIGALMVFEQETILGDIISSGTVIDAKVSPEMIGNIFYPGAPLHDGAAVFRRQNLRRRLYTSADTESRYQQRARNTSQSIHRYERAKRCCYSRCIRGDRSHFRGI